MIPPDFEERARRRWTAERVRKVTAGKRWPVTPDVAPRLLRVMGLLNADTSMSADAHRKLAQVNHLLLQLAPSLEDLARRQPCVRVLDAACGTSFVALLVAWFLHERSGKACEILGIDANPKLVQRSRQRAAALGWQRFACFSALPLESGAWRAGYSACFAGAGTRAPQVGSPQANLPRPNLVLALHACDTASDEALGLGVLEQADVIAAAPCCQAELARAWAALPNDVHPLAPLFHTAALRREAAATVTDALRMLLLRACGYEVTVGEFVAPAHTPKNRLLLATRRGRFLEDASRRHAALQAAFGGCSIRLARILHAAGRLAPPGGALLTPTR